MDPQRWRALSPHLDRALEMAGEERDRWLEALRAEDPALASELARLLDSDRALEEQGFLEGPAAPATGERSLAGQVVGSYVLRSLIGQGGMGSVWLAERADGRFEGQAAVKLLNASLVGREGEARFRREGNILARLRHANIAHLADAGVSPFGHPYLVLEHVDGERIDAYCDARGLGIEARLRLFLDVLGAVAHAHGRLVVHRDLKPSNILVTRDGRVKLLDFGIAKLLESDDEEASPTREGRTALTPQYAAPEQLTGGDVTTATDVYALGGLLYLLLAGRHAAGSDSSTPAELVRAIVDREAPRLSDAAAAGGDGPPAAALAARRHTTPRRLRRTLRGDLDNIVAKALRKQPSERYASVEALADDLRRYLERQPVHARADSFAYRTRKFVARHRAGVAVAAALAALVAGGVVRERVLRARADAEARKAAAVKDYLVSVFDVSDPFSSAPRGGDVTARALLDRGAARVDAALAGQPEVQSELLGALGRVYTSLGVFDTAAALQRRALEQQRARLGPRHPDVAEAMDQLGLVLSKQNQFAQAEPLLREALAQRRALLGDTHAATAASVNHLATLLQVRNDYAGAEPLFREVIAIRRAVHGGEHNEVATARGNLAVLLYLRGRYEEAETLHREALAGHRRHLGEDHAQVAVSMQNLAQVLQARGQFEEAESLQRQALATKRKLLGDAHPTVAVSLGNLGMMLAHELDQPEKGEPLVLEALAMSRRIFGPRHVYVSDALHYHGTILRLKGDFEAGLRVGHQALEMNRSLFGNQHVKVANNLNSIGVMLHLKGDLDRAVAVLRESLALYVRLVGEKHRNSSVVAITLAKALREKGQAAEAESLLRAAAARLDAANRDHRSHLIRARVGLGQVLTDQGRHAEALPILEEVVAMANGQFGAGNWRAGEAGLALGACLAAAGEPARAEPLLRTALAALETRRPAQPRVVGAAESALAEVYRALGRPHEARALRSAAR
jgi:eukaryotic-like serine/threonine-protein kinase